jgi:hypothetical protein
MKPYQDIKITHVWLEIDEGETGDISFFLWTDIIGEQRANFRRKFLRIVKDYVVYYVLSNSVFFTEQQLLNVYHERMNNGSISRYRLD